MTRNATGFLFSVVFSFVGFLYCFLFVCLFFFKCSICKFREEEKSPSSLWERAENESSIAISCWSEVGQRWGPEDKVTNTTVVINVNTPKSLFTHQQGQHSWTFSSGKYGKWKTHHFFLSKKDYPHPINNAHCGITSPWNGVLIYLVFRNTYLEKEAASV